MPTPKQLHSMRDFYRQPDFVVHEVMDLPSSDEEDNNDDNDNETKINHKSSSLLKDKVNLNYQIQPTTNLLEYKDVNGDQKESIDSKNNDLFKCVDFNNKNKSTLCNKSTLNIINEVIKKNYLSTLNIDSIHLIVLYIDIESIYNFYLSCNSKFMRQNLRKTLGSIHTGNDNEIFTYANQSCNNRISSIHWALNSISGNYNTALNDFSNKYTNIKNSNLKNIELCIINNNENNSNIDILTKHKDNLLHLSSILASGCISNLQVLKIKFEIGVKFESIDIFYDNIIKALKNGYLNKLSYFGLEIEGINNRLRNREVGHDLDLQLNDSLLYYIKTKCTVLQRLEGLKYFNIDDYYSLIPYYYLKEQNLMSDNITNIIEINQIVEKNQDNFQNSSWFCLETIDLGTLIITFSNHFNVEFNIAVIVTLRTLTVSRFPSLKKLELCFNDSDEILIFFSELSTLINDQYVNNVNENDCFVGKQIESIYLNQDNINARENLELHQKWNDLFKNNKFNHKPNELFNDNKHAFPNVSILHINHWLPSVQLLMNVIGCNKECNGLNLIIAAGNECPSLTSFLSNYWDENILPISRLQLVHRNMNSYNLLDSFINFDKVSIKIKAKLSTINTTKPYQDSINNAVSHIYSVISDFRDEFQVDLFDETSIVDKSIMLLENNDKLLINQDKINYLRNSNNIVNISIYKSILNDKMINLKELGITELFLDLLLQDDDDDVLIDRITISNGFTILQAANTIVRNIIDKCLNLEVILLTLHPPISTESLDVYVNEVSYKLFIFILSLKNNGITPIKMKKSNNSELNSQLSVIKFSHLIINITSYFLLQQIENKINLFFKSWSLLDINDCYLKYIGKDKLIINFDNNCFNK
jgi:hypothetical protein